MSPADRLSFCTIRAMALHQRTAPATAFDQIATIMFAIAPMIAHGCGHLKMPRLDAYAKSTRFSTIF
jgi:hypothetical protein